MNIQLVIVHSDWSMFKSVQWGPKSLLGLPSRAANNNRGIKGPCAGKKLHAMNNKPNILLFHIGAWLSLKMDVKRAVRQNLPLLQFLENELFRVWQAALRR